MVTILNKCSQRRDLVTCASAFAKAGLVQQLCAILRRINLCNILKQKTTKEKIEMITELSLIYHVKKTIVLNALVTMSSVSDVENSKN